MRTTVAILALAPAVCSGQSLTYAYDFGLKEAAPVVTSPVGRLTNVFGKGFSLDVDGFAGVTLKSKTPLAGFLVGRRFPLANEAQAYVGAGLSIAQGRSFSPVAGLGLTWKF